MRSAIPRSNSTAASRAACFGILAFSLLWIGAPRARAQERGASFNGSVSDQSGPPINGATVTVKELNTGQIRSTTTSSGTYSLPLLPAGTYTLACSHAGFATEVHSNLTLTVDQLATVDCSLRVGEVNQSVEVESTVEQLNTINGELGSTINEKAIVELP